AEKVRETPESVIPAYAGIQHLTDFVGSNILDPGFRRGDEEFFSNLLGDSEQVRRSSRARSCFDRPFLSTVEGLSANGFGSA
ncbi:MAG: hypothetical protein NUV34_08855, partial [Sulfuricaulis sp.]|nr:hypothetical protein [Sulfuricaulis sp.]